MNLNIENEFKAGLIFHQKGNITEAETKYKKVLAIEDNHFDSLHLLGVVKSQKGDYKKAIFYIKKALELNKANPMVYNNLAIVYMEMNNYKEALHYCNMSLSLDNNNLEAIYNKGRILSENEDYIEAEILFKKLIKLDPNYYKAYLSLGILSLTQGKTESSINYYNKLIQLKPDFVDAYYNLGNIYLDLEKNDLAELNYIKALKCDPKNSQVYNNLGTVYQNINKIEEAKVCFEKSLKLNSSDTKSFHNLIDLHLKRSNWSEIKNYINSYDSIKQFKELGIPVNTQVIFDRPDYQKYVNETFLSYSGKSEINNFNYKRKLNSKIKLAYFSADYSDDNPVAYLISDLIKFHNRDKFEIYGCSLKGIKDKDNTRKYYEKYFDHFLNIQNLTNKEIEELCILQKFDIVIDLNGYTKYARPALFSKKLAPIQVNYLGYPGTLGSKMYDYIIADKTVIPPQYAMHYTESIAYLPCSYFANPQQRKSSSKKFSRQELGLPLDSVVFSCFNQNYKILPNIYEVWMRILKKVEGSVLLLSYTNQLAKKNLKLEAEKKDVNPDRIFFGEYLKDIGDHLKRYKVIDVFLDTMPYNAHTTASDAIWSGIPLITCIGKSFASRVSSSILKSVGLEELITQSLKEYEEKAVQLALNPKKLKDLKLQLNNQRTKVSLFNSNLYTKNLEKAYEEMHRNFYLGNPSKTFEI